MSCAETLTLALPLRLQGRSSSPTPAPSALARDMHHFRVVAKSASGAAELYKHITNPSPFLTGVFMTQGASLRHAAKAVKLGAGQVGGWVGVLWPLSLPRLLNAICICRDPCGAGDAL